MPSRLATNATVWGLRSACGRRHLAWGSPACLRIGFQTMPEAGSSHLPAARPVCWCRHVLQWFANHVACFAAVPNLPHPLHRKAHDNTTHVVLLPSPSSSHLPCPAHMLRPTTCWLPSRCSCDVFFRPPSCPSLLSRHRKRSIRCVSCASQSKALTGWLGLGLHGVGHSKRCWSRWRGRWMLTLVEGPAAPCKYGMATTRAPFAASTHVSRSVCLVGVT
jgi:hypothetical protein